MWKRHEEEDFAQLVTFLRSNGDAHPSLVSWVRWRRYFLFLRVVPEHIPGSGNTWACFCPADRWPESRPGSASWETVNHKRNASFDPFLPASMNRPAGTGPARPAPETQTLELDSLFSEWMSTLYRRWVPRLRTANREGLLTLKDTSEHGHMAFSWY